MNASAERDWYFDNIKFLLILAVVLGHFIEPAIGNNGLLKVLYLFIYTFHMPAFALVTGYFSKAERGWSRLRFIDAHIIPYVIFQFAFIVFAYFALRGQYGKNMFQPYYVYWFLPALFAWNLLLPLAAKAGRAALAAAVALGLAAGYVQPIGLLFSLSRIIVFFPFFIGGYLLKKEHFLCVRAKIKREYAVMILLAILVLWVAVGKNVNVVWLWGTGSYGALGDHSWYAGIYRLGLYALAAAAFLAVCVLVPQRRMAFSYIGAATLPVYLLHGFVVKLLVSSGFYMAWGIAAMIPAVMLLTAAAVLALSWKPVVRFFKPVMQPKLAVLLAARLSKTSTPENP